MVARKLWELYETRIISGRGLFIILPDDNLRHLYLYVNLLREPSVNFTNSKFNPDKSEYGKVTWMRENYVLREDAINYPNQRFQWACDPSATGYLATGLICLIGSLADQIEYGFTYLGVPPSIPGDTIYVEPLRDAPTDIKIVCRGDTALECQLWKLDYDYACPAGLPTPKPPPDPPQPIPDPPGTPRDDISPPYVPPSDDNDTVPNPSDEFPPDPPPTGTPTWTVVTTERTLIIVSPDPPVTFSNFRCTTERGLQAVGHLGDNQLTQYCGEFSNYCLNAGETVVSVTPTGDYCEETYP